MKNLGIHLTWICVKNLKAALQFYTEVAGFSLQEESPEFGWAELSGPSGVRLGIAQENAHEPIKAGSNAIPTITVDNIEKARHFFQEKGARLIGDILEIPGHVKMQTFQDLDGNTMQLVQVFH